MGPRVMRHLPKYVHGFIDRHGRPRFYFRRAGFKKVPLPGLPWAPEFMAAYEEAVAGQPAPIEVGAARTKPGSMRALSVSYFQSIDYRSLQARTQRVYRGLIDRFCEQADKDGNKFGDKRAALIGREHIVRLIAARADKPESANQFRKVLRAMMKHAVEIGLRADDPTKDVRALRAKSDGFHGWTDEEIARFENHHSVGSRARLAFALLLYTGQRRSDVVRMGRQHVRSGVLTVRQKKTGAQLSIPVHPTLQAILDFGNWFRDQCNAAGLPQCSAHGLRKAAARWLAEAGCTAHEIASITGHASLKQVAHYTRAADQGRLASAAMEKVKARTSSG
jgi:integrase